MVEGFRAEVHITLIGLAPELVTGRGHKYPVGDNEGRLRRSSRY